MKRSSLCTSRLAPLSIVSGLVLASCAARPAKVASPAAGPSSAAETPAAAKPADELDRPLPLDPRVHRGTLPNGLTYYIRQHGVPENRAYFRLVVNAGSVYEDDDQRGLAHFIEHMGFNGTRRFPRQALVDALERLGMRYGADLNAQTSFDETVFMLEVPSDKPEPIAQALSMLRDFAADVTFDPVEVDKERGVVLEEWRLGRGAATRLLEKEIPVLFHGSKYAERLPIGTPETLRAAPRDALVRFYRDWYRPDRMAVIAVGDFEIEDIEARIKKEFGDLAAPAKPRPAPVVDLPRHAETLVSIETDPEMPRATVALYSMRPHQPEGSARDYRRNLGDQLYHAMLSERLDEIRRRPDAPFLAAYSGAASIVRNADAVVQGAEVREDGVMRGLAAILEEVARVERHGFTEGELKRARREMMREYQRLVTEREKLDGAQFASEIGRHFLEDEAMPGPVAELELVRRFLPTFTLEELNGLSRSWAERGRVITVSGPASMKTPSKEEVLALAGAVEGREVTAWKDDFADAPLLSKPPTPGLVVGERTIPEVGLREWTLSNGARVVLKTTRLKNDEILMTGFSPGGHSLVPDADYESAAYADEIVAESGAGAWSAVSLQKLLAGRAVSVSPSVDELSEAISGTASTEDLETMLQLAHLYMTSPRRDEQAFAAWRARRAQEVRNRGLSPERSFMDDVQRFVASDHPRRRPMTPERVEKVNLDRALAIYKDRFADASDFTFVFVGNVDADKLLPLVTTYLGSLPSTHRAERFRDVGVRWPKGAVTMKRARGHEPKSLVLLAFHGEEPWSREADEDLSTLSDILDIRLREVLREDMGGVYGIYTMADFERRPRPQYQFEIFFGCAPDNMAKLEKAVFDEIQAIQQKGIGEDYLHKVREALRRQHELDMKDNQFWRRSIVRALDYGDDPRQILDVEGRVARITAERVQATAKRFLRTGECVVGELRPEGAK